MTIEEAVAYLKENFPANITDRDVATNVLLTAYDAREADTKRLDYAETRVQWVNSHEGYVMIHLPLKTGSESLRELLDAALSSKETHTP